MDQQKVKYLPVALLGGAAGVSRTLLVELLSVQCLKARGSIVMSTHLLPSFFRLGQGFLILLSP